MAYTINGKVYTEHSLMDEVIYNLDIIMKNIEIKDEDKALKYETEDSLEASDYFLSICDGTITFEVFPFTIAMLQSYGYSKREATDYVADRYLIPEEDRDAVLEYCCDLYTENYIEENNYYRMLAGLPWLDINEEPEKYYVYIDETYITDYNIVDEFDFDIPLHEYTDYQMALLVALGIMDTIYEEYNTKEYKYLHFLGDLKLDIYTCRIAAKWDILYMPSVESLVSDRFKELYQINRNIVLQRHYSEAYKLNSDYYDEFMIVILLCQTYTDMVTDLPEWYIRRDIFDLRSCQYFLESNGIEFFKEIPLKYQIRIVKNMNKLIRYKSTNQNIWDIISLFDLDVTVYKYYIFKQRSVLTGGAYTDGDTDEEKYELKFVQAAIGDTYDNYIKDSVYVHGYDDITYEDKYWDGQDTHEYVKTNHVNKDFTIEGTKIMSIEANISLSEYAFQTEYFLGLILDSDLDTSDLTVSIPSISNLVSFPLTDLFIMLYCLTAAYDGYNLLIRTPVDINTEDKPEYESFWQDNTGCDEDEHCLRPMSSGWEAPQIYMYQEMFYDWLAWKYSYLWSDLNCKVNGFNLSADLDELQEMIGFRHSTYGFERGYTLEELGVDGYISATSVSTIDELVELYTTNKEIYDNLKEAIIYAQTRDEKVVLEFVFNYLFTKEYDYEKYTLKSGELATSYDEILKEKNYILYLYYTKVIAEVDPDTRQDMIRVAMNDIISVLEYYLNDDSLNYIFATFTTTSFNSLIKYIYLMINFFKSWKVYFLDPYVTYTADDKLDNRVSMNDGIGSMTSTYWKSDRELEDDTLQINLEFTFEDRYSEDNVVEVMDLFGHLEYDPLFDFDIKGNFIAEGWMMTDLDGGPAEDQEYVLNIDGKDAEDGSEYYYNIIAGFSNTELPDIDDHVDDPGTILHGEIRDINGGGVPFTSYIPYIQYNGGVEGYDRFLHDLDGAYPYSQMRYADIDGKGVTRYTYYPYTTEELVNVTTEDDGSITIPEDYMTTVDHSTKTPTYGYNVDGGHPDWNMFTTSSMIVRVKDNQITMDVKLLPAIKDVTNLITIDNEGLYMKDEWMSYDQLEALKADMEAMLAKYNSFWNDSLDTLVVTSDGGIIYNRIITILDDYFTEAINAYELVTGGLEKINNDYTDKRAQELEDNIYELIDNLIAWSRF